MKKQKLKRISKLFGIIFMAVMLSLMFSLADLFSSLISVGGFSFTSSDINFSKYTVYAVCTSSHKNAKSASSSANSLKAQGGAGYVYINSDNYLVVASMYEAKPDAEKVAKALKTSFSGVDICTIEIKPIVLSCNLEQEQKLCLENAVGIFKNAYKKLYDISVSLDTGVITEVNSRLQVNQLASQVQEIFSNFNTLFSNNASTGFLQIKLKLQKLLDIMQAIVEPDIEILYTSLLKEAYCKTIETYKSLANSL